MTPSHMFTMHQGQTAAGSNEAPQPEVFIGRIPSSVTLGLLEQHLLPYGATRVRMLEGKGCAFATFQSMASAESAIAALNGTKLADGIDEGINVKFADGKGVRIQQQDPRVFIGRINDGVTNEMVQQVCQEFGTVLRSNIYRKNESSLPAAFVTFSSFEEANTCISNLDGMEHLMAREGAQLQVKLANQERKQPGMAMPGGNMGMMVGNMGMMAGGMGGGLPMGNMVMMGGNRCMASGMAPMPPMGGGMAPMAPMGCMGGNGMPMGGQNIGGNMGMVGGMAPMAPMGGMGSNGRPMGGQNTFDPSQPMPPKLFIGGLPEAVTETFLFGMFSIFGDLHEAKIFRKPGSRGPCGFIRFIEAGVAESAMEVINQYGRYHVKYADADRDSQEGAAGANKRTYATAFQG